MSRVDKIPATPDVPTAPDGDVTTEILRVVGLSVVGVIVAAGLYWYFFKGGRHWF